jgi:hypothetical protein
MEMTETPILLQLQREQLRHDEAYHEEILVLDTARRTKHMALHQAKYTARFVAAEEDGDADLFRATLTDAFIISLATANIFAQNLSETLPEGIEDKGGLAALGVTLAERIAQTVSFVRQFSALTGEMAKACESLDHLEAFPFRQSLVRANTDMSQLLICEASSRQIDLAAAYEARISDVEQRSPRRFLHA